MSHIMLDLETLGVIPGCIILSIGAVVFSPSFGLGPEFSKVISQRSCKAAGLRAETATLAWWQRQSPEAQAIIPQSECMAAFDLEEALMDFSRFIAEHGGRSARVWGNGADFDNAILATAAHAIGIRIPWSYTKSRCYRTLKACAPSIKPPLREGIYHNSLDDAKFQAAHAIAIMKSFGNAAKAEVPHQEQGELSLLTGMPNGSD